MSGAGCVGVRELVDENESGLAGENSFQIHLRSLHPFIIEKLWCGDRQSRKQGLSVDESMCLHHSNHDIFSIPPLLLRSPEHGVGFADARAHAEKYFQPAASRARFLMLERGHERIGIGT